eukprot:10619758-Prorocentrum_lima.AAC.1
MHPSMWMMIKWTKAAESNSEGRASITRQFRRNPHVDKRSNRAKDSSLCGCFAAGRKQDKSYGMSDCS